MARNRSMKKLDEIPGLMKSQWNQAPLTTLNSGYNPTYQWRSEKRRKGNIKRWKRKVCMSKAQNTVTGGNSKIPQVSVSVATPSTMTVLSLLLVKSGCNSHPLQYIWNYAGLFQFFLSWRLVQSCPQASVQFAQRLRHLNYPWDSKVTWAWEYLQHHSRQQYLGRTCIHLVLSVNSSLDVMPCSLLTQDSLQIHCEDR